MRPKGKIEIDWLASIKKKFRRSEKRGWKQKGKKNGRKKGA